MKKIFYIFLSRPVTVSMVFISVVILGLISVYNLPLELSPHAEFPKLTVTTSWNGVSPEVIEAYLTSPIESQLAGIKGVKKISSRSSEGISRVSLEFYPSVDMDFIRIEINERLASIKNDLPFGVSPPRISPYIPEDLQELQGFITYTISGSKSANEIRKYVKEKMVYPLLSINGVSNVVVRGGNEREINIVVDYDKVKSFNIKNSEITNAVANAEKILSAGSIKKNGVSILVNIKNKINDLSIIENQPVRFNNNGSIIKLKDIAKVYDDYKEATSYYRINGKETVSLVISKEPGTNTLETASKVYAKMKTIEKNAPQDYKIDKEIDKSDSIRKELSELTKNGIFSFIIIFIVLLIIYKRINYVLIILTSIIFSLLSSFLLFFLFNIPLNILTIAAFILGFGFMVDNSIVVIDYIDSHYDGRGIKYLTVHLKNIFLPVFASTLTTVAVFVPLLFLTGELRLYFVQFALGIVFTLTASLIVSFVIIPLLYLRFGGKSTLKKNSEKNIPYKIYSFIMRKMFKWKKLSFALLILIIGIPVWLIPPNIETPVIKSIYNPIFDSDTWSEIKPYVNYALGGTINLFFNHISRGEVWQFGEETYIFVRLELPNGNRIERINNLTKDFEKEILRYRKNFKNLIVNVQSEENAFIRIEFTKQQSETAFPYLLKNYLTSYATRLGGLNVSVYGFGPGFSTGGGSYSSFSVIAKGFNYLHVKELAEKFRNIIKRNPRIDNVDIDKSAYYWAKDTYEIIGEIKRKNLAHFGITVKDLFSTIARNTEGNLTWNKFIIENDEVPYNIKYSNYKNIQLSQLNSMIISNHKRSTLKVKNLINFKERKVLSAINRENQQYVRYITLDYKGPYKYGKKFIDASIKKILIPPGYSLKQREFRFRFGEQDEINIWKILIMSIVLIFMITAGLFESYTKPILIWIAIPFAFIGTIFLFYLGDYNLDRGAYAGLLLLIGLSVNNSIILIDYITSYYKHTSAKSKVDFNKIISLSYTRLRPIFTTTVTTITALIPLLISAESSFWKSLSLCVTGGILLSAILVVLYLPLFFSKIRILKLELRN